MNPADFITIAGTLAGRGPAGARTAISRAYYGAFHLASQLLTKLDCASPRGGIAHSLVPIFLESAANLNAQVAAQILRDLHRDRIKADYELSDPRNESLAQAQLAVERALQVERHLAEFELACKSQPVVDGLKTAVAKVRGIYRI